MSFWKQIKPQNPEKRQQKNHFLKNLYTLFDGRRRVLDAFESKIFPIKIEDTGFSDRTKEKISDLANVKTLLPKQILQRLQIALSQVKVGNTS